MDWNEVFEKHGRALVLFARQWVPSISDAEDLVQEGFLKVYKAKTPIEAERIVPSLYNAVRWCALDQIRSQNRRKKREEKASDPNAVAWFESTLDNDIRLQEIERALKSIPENQREVLVMKIWSDLSFREIGEALDIPLNTAASRYRYALEGLRRSLDPEIVGGT